MKPCPVRGFFYMRLPSVAVSCRSSRAFAGHLNVWYWCEQTFDVSAETFPGIYFKFRD